MANKASQKSLAKQSEKAASQVTVGAIYMHYKQKPYKVIGLAFLEATMELHVIYQALYDEQITFLRPVKIWNEEVEWEGEKVPRFKRVEEA